MIWLQTDLPWHNFPPSTDSSPLSPSLPEMIRLPSDLLWHKFPPSANHSPHPPSQSKVIQCQDWLSFVFMTSLFLDYKAMTLFPLRFDPCASCKLPLVAPYLWIKSGMHAFLKNGNDLFLTQVSVCMSVSLSDWNGNYMPWQTDQWYCPGNWQRTWLKKIGFLNDPIGLVRLSVYSTISSTISSTIPEDERLQNW